MPGTVEAALILLVLAGPGFIASRFLNSLVAYRQPTAFQETTQAVVFSAVMVPIWLLAARPLLASRNAMLVVWRDQQQASQLPVWAIGMPILVFALVYFVVAPCVAIIWAAFIRRRPHIRTAQFLLGAAGLKLRYDEGPEVWDEMFGSDDAQRWVRVAYKDGTAIEGVLVGAGVSPAARQLHLSSLELHLSSLEGVVGSLTILNAAGAVVDDLSGRNVESVWLDVTSEVRYVEVFSS